MIKGVKMGRTCSTYQGDDKCIQKTVTKPGRNREHLRDQGIIKVELIDQGFEKNIPCFQYVCYADVMVYSTFIMKLFTCHNISLGNVFSQVKFQKNMVDDFYAYYMVFHLSQPPVTILID
jgi:hypothetical protein